MIRTGLAICLLGLGAGLSLAQPVAPRFERVTEGVYAHIGDIGPRTVANEGLNANIGLVVTPEGALLIDSGATYLGARAIEAAARRVTAQPIRWVINTGGQDHRWLGNGYFQARGAELIAHARAVPDMQARGGDQMQALQALLGPRFEGTRAVFPTRLIDADDAMLELGGLRVALRHRGGGHTPGDLMVWLPQQQVLFSGDIVYVDRLLGVLPVSQTRHWLQAFDAIEALQPRHLVPGHGRVSDLALARAHTRDYLRALRAHMRQAVDALSDIGEAVRAFELGDWGRLANAAELHPGNASRVYLELERE